MSQVRSCPNWRTLTVIVTNTQSRPRGHSVVGATVGDAVKRLGIDLASLNGAFLAPGVGAQGAGPAQVREVFAGAEDAVLASSSRAILRSGPSIAGLRDAYRATVDSLQ